MSRPSMFKGVALNFKGMTPHQKEQSIALWEAWCKRTRRRPHLRDAAVRFTDDFERKAGIGPSMKNLAPEAWHNSGSPLLTPKEQRELVRILQRVWHYGLSFAIWAEREGIFSRKA